MTQHVLYNYYFLLWFSEEEPYYATVDNVLKKDAKDDISMFTNQAYSQVGLSTICNEAYAVFDSKCTNSSSAYAEISDLAVTSVKWESNFEEATSKKVENLANLRAP